MIVAVVGLCYYVQEVLLTESKSQCAIVQEHLNVSALVPPHQQALRLPVASIWRDVSMPVCCIFDS